MSLCFTKCKSPSGNKYVKYIVNEIKNNINLLIYISRIFDIHRENKEELLDKVKNTILLNLNHSRLQLAQNKREELINVIIEIYKQKNFSDIRSAILEQIVSEFGPFTIDTVDLSCYLEPVIIDKTNGNKLVGESETRCDVVFHRSDYDQMEFIECKANIANVIPADLSFDDPGFNESHRKKVVYLDNVYTYLKENYREPIIYFACFNNNYEIQLRNIRDNWGFPHFNFINPVEIYKHVSKRQCIS